MMREISASSGPFVPALLLASVLHAAVIFGVRVDLVRHLPADHEALEISLEPTAVFDASRQFAATLGPQQTAPVRTSSSPPLPADTPVDGEATLLKDGRPPQGVSSRRVVATDRGRGEGDVDAAGLMPRQRRSRLQAAAGRDGADTVESVAASSVPLRQTDLATSTNAPAEYTGAGSQQTGIVTATDTPLPGNRDRKQRQGAEPIPFSSRAQEVDDGAPARLTAASLGRQVSEWSAEYLRTPQAEPAQPPRTAHVEKVGSHRVAAAAYERAWQDKVERVGNMNYPEDARRKNLTGGLMLSVAVNADGSINTIQVRSSSGHEELDQAAIRIVRLAAPFAAFPSELKEDYDVLWITRTWRFFIDNHLATAP